MSDGHRWLVGWYATRLHAVKADDAGTNYNYGTMPTEYVAECGVRVYETPPNDWARERLDGGLPRCSFCEKHVEES